MPDPRLFDQSFQSMHSTDPIDPTHAPALRSWVPGSQDGDFPIQNLPYCVFSREPTGEDQIGVGIGVQILAMREAVERGLLDNLPAETLMALREPRLNRLMALSAFRRREVRQGVSRLLEQECATIRDDVVLREELLWPASQAVFRVPAAIGDYTDFYASLDHATNVGCMFRPNQPLLPNYKWLPIGYHGRSSSIVVSGTAIRRPTGQLPPGASGVPGFGPSRTLDYEQELAIWVASENSLGAPMSIDVCEEERLFGVGLLNDWSARDLQKWEYQPLGPFLGKNFATSVAPWIVTREALAPFRCPAASRAEGDPQPLEHLHSARTQAGGGLDITLEVHLSTDRMRAAGLTAVRISRSFTRRLYWTASQMLAHHVSNGCNLRPGDLLGSGTVSGATVEERGCLLERTWAGKAAQPLPGSRRQPLELPNGERREFLEDGDEVILVGFCEHGDYRRIGLGECRGRVV